MVEYIYKDITYVIGDIFDAIKNNDIDVLAHQANCMSVMGSGIAASIRTRYPMVYEADVNDPRYSMERFGSYSFAITEDKVMVFNLYGQYQPGPCTDYPALTAALHEMAASIKIYNPTLRIGLPLIGCGVGMGDWAIVSEILVRALDGLDWTVYVLNQETFDRVVRKSA